MTSRSSRTKGRDASSTKRALDQDPEGERAEHQPPEPRTVMASKAQISAILTIDVAVGLAFCEEKSVPG